MATYNPGDKRHPPTYSVGDGTYSIKFSEVEDLFDSVPDEDYYAIIATGYYSIIYPGHTNDPGDMTTLSYSIEKETLLDALYDENYDTVAEWLNSVAIPETSVDLGHWEDITKLYIIVRHE